MMKIMSCLLHRISRASVVTLAFLSAAAPPTAAGWEPNRPPATGSDSSLRVVGGVLFQSRRTLPWSPTILPDSRRVVSLAAALAAETRTQVFGDKRIDG